MLLWVDLLNLLAVERDCLQLVVELFLSLLAEEKKLCSHLTNEELAFFVRFAWIDANGEQSLEVEKKSHLLNLLSLNSLLILLGLLTSAGFE